METEVFKQDVQWFREKAEQTNRPELAEKLRKYADEIEQAIKEIENGEYDNGTK